MQKFWQGISCRGNFHDATPISLVKAYGFYFHMGVIFVKTKVQKTRKLPPRENFHLYTNDAISNPTKVDDLVTLTFIPKIAYQDLLVR